jgi:hypothetical protein
MKNIILIILFLGVGQIQAQTKKEQLQILNFKLDSLINLINSERYLNIIEKNKCDGKIQNYIKDLESLNISIEKLYSNIDKYKFKLDSVNSAFKIEIKKMRDSLINRSSKQPVQIALSYRYSYVKDPNEDKILSTVYLPFKNSFYIIADSSNLNVTENDPIYFYFITPLKEEINLSCPNEYGLIVLNKNGDEIYKSIWDMNSEAVLEGNCYPKVMQFKTNSGFRNLLSISSSGCGSGASTQYYDILYSVNKIEFKEAFSCGGGYSDFYFIPEKNKYFEIERINPECHYSCPSRYKISIYLLSNDKLLKSNMTKFNYDDYNDIGIEELIKTIRIKEPNVLSE